MIAEPGAAGAEASAGKLTLCCIVAAGGETALHRVTATSVFGREVGIRETTDLWSEIALGIDF